MHSEAGSATSCTLHTHTRTRTPNAAARHHTPSGHAPQHASPQANRRGHAGSFRRTLPRPCAYPHLNPPQVTVMHAVTEQTCVWTPRMQPQGGEAAGAFENTHRQDRRFLCLFLCLATTAGQPRHSFLAPQSHATVQRENRLEGSQHFAFPTQQNMKKGRHEQDTKHRQTLAPEPHSGGKKHYGKGKHGEEKRPYTTRGSHTNGKTKRRAAREAHRMMQSWCYAAGGRQ